MKRIDERILMSEADIRDILATALVKNEYSQKAPKWYYGDGQLRESTIWVSFKDLDGIPCAAVIDTEQQSLVTVVKK